MPSVFLSYSRADLPVIEQLEAHLRASAPDISIWRDQEKIYGGQTWPKVLGEAIADQDIFLLAWSKHSATSHFVELEWNTAIALKKTVVPCLLDDTALAPILCALHGLRPNDVHGLSKALRAAPLADAQRRSSVIASLATVTATDEETAFKQAKTILAPQVLIVLGDVYGDVHIHQAPDNRRDQNTKNLLKAVRSTWIKGYLEPNLKDSRTITLHKTIRRDQVDPPLKQAVGLPSPVSQDVPQDKPLIELFDDATGFLLILGEPGSGKTITLLELAVSLLDRAETNSDEPVPVILNLSTWSGKGQSLTDWMVDELGNHHRVPEDLGRTLIKDGRLYLLLDGFDEVLTESREACIQAINSFLKDPGAPGMVVCSRTSEYSQLSNKLKLNEAVQLLSLTDSQISQYIDDVAGKRSPALRSLIESDDTLRELAQSPLMLSITLRAYHDAPEDVLELKAATSSKDRHTRLFNRYVETMLSSKGTSSRRYAPEVVTNGLSWLATQLQKYSQTTFLLENLQPSWLTKSRDRWLYYISSRIAGVAFVVAMSYLIIWPVMFITENWTKYQDFPWLPVILTIVAPFLFGLVYGLPAGILDGLLLGKRDAETKQPTLSHPRHHPIKHISIYAMTYGAVGGLFSMLSYLEPSKANWQTICLSVLSFSMVGLIPGFRSAKRTLETDIHTTTTLPWSWEKSGRAYIRGTVLYLSVLAIAFASDFLLSIFDMNKHPSVSLSLSTLLAALGFVFRAHLMQTLTYGLPQLRKLVSATLGRGLQMILLAQLVIGIFSYIVWRLSGQTTLGRVGHEVFSGDALSLVVGILFATFGGMRRDSIGSTTSYPNQGIVLSIKNAFLITSFTLPLWLAMVIFIMFSPMKPAEMVNESTQLSLFSLFSTLLAFIIPIAAWYGTDVVQHYVLRTLLYWRGATPRHYVKFLDYAVSLIFLRKVGGGYLFIHRLILEHFADMPNREKAPVPHQGQT